MSMSADTERELAALKQAVADLEIALSASSAERDELSEQRLATADVLKAISRPGFDLDSVMDTIAQSAARLCRADLSAVSLREGEVLISRGAFHTEARLAAFVKQTPIALDDQSYVGRAVLTGTVQHIPDFAKDTTIKLRTFQKALGFQTIVFVPLMREGRGIGVISLARNLVNGFSEREIELVSTFTHQAVIAIENVRLFEQVQERTRELTLSLDDLRSTQQRLVQTEKLAALGQLTSGIAHEINGPVGTSLTIASTLAERCAAFSQEQAAGQLRRSQLDAFIDSNRQAAKQLIVNLQRAGELVRSFKQVAVDQGTAGRHAFDLAIATRQKLTSLRSNVDGIDVAIDIDVPDGIVMKSYPDSYGQILNNLFVNSVAHGFDGARQGLITVTASLLDENRVELRFSDNGRGMPDVVQQHAFDPFFTTSRNQGSTGLGLHIVHTIVTQRLGGQIALISAPGQGASFVMTLPLASPGG